MLGTPQAKPTATGGEKSLNGGIISISMSLAAVIFGLIRIPSGGTSLGSLYKQFFIKRYENAIVCRV